MDGLNEREIDFVEDCCERDMRFKTHVNIEKGED